MMKTATRNSKTTKKALPKYTFHLVPCPGEAHQPGVFQDYCMLCAPLWGEVAIPADCASVNIWREKFAKLELDARNSYIRQEKRFVAQKQKEDDAERTARLNPEKKITLVVRDDEVRTPSKLADVLDAVIGTVHALEKGTMHEHDRADACREAAEKLLKLMLYYQAI